MKILYAFLSILLWTHFASAQYSDFIGAGHITGIQVSSSDATSTPESTLDGSGLDVDLRGASRFLSRASMGATIDDIKYVSEVGIEQWIDEQLDIPSYNYTINTVENIFELYEQCLNNLGEQECNREFILNPAYFRYSWWDNVVNGEDRLRQRIALALSEILVVSDNSELINFPHGVAAYYDILSKHAFGNYRDLLWDVTLNPSMGYYLSHINNPKTDEENNIHPDENYAREIMQLFTIGLYELNNDGSRKLDGSGLWIPTYDNDDIKGLAKVFTGLSGSKYADEEITFPVIFGLDFRAYSLLDPMKMFPLWHEPGSKTIVGDYTIQDADPMKEVELAIDHLFNHPNVGPFLAYRLIQRLVKSNPSPAYVDRVASVFNDNGNGERGDLKAMIKAIYLDEEALECYWFEDMANGQLREPILRYTQLMIALRAQTRSEKFWNTAFFFQRFTDQHPMSSPTVFNFFKPDYVPDSDFAYYDMSGPEFQILNSSTASNYVNFMLFALMRDYFTERYGLRLPDVLNEPFLIPYVEDQDIYKAELSDELWLELAYSPTELVDYLDIVLANGFLSDESRSKISNSITPDNILNEFDKSNYALFLLMIHPDYVIMK